MSPWEGFLVGLGVAVSPENLLAALAGALVGTAIGVLPGLGPVAGAALVLPLTFTLPPVTGLIALAAIYYGSMYGGSTTAILVNVPGETASVVTTLDGYQMTRKGRAGAALAIVAFGSFIAGTIGTAGVMLFSPVLSSIGLLFGPPAFFALTTVGLLVLCRVTGGSLAASLFLVTLGLLLSTIGVEAITGVRRFDFGVLELALGLEVVPAAVGLFGIAEVLVLVETLGRTPRPRTTPLREMLPTRQELGRAAPAWLRGTGIGFLVGLVPGPAATLSTFMAYRLERAVSKRPEEFGHGAVEGVAGPEAANNAAATSGLVPLLSLGIPFSPVLALVMAAMMVHGVQPGPLLITQRPDVFWGILASMYLGNVALLALNLPLVGMWVRLLRIPQPLLIVSIVLFSVVGTYAVRNSTFDLWVLVGFGFAGYVLQKLSLDRAPLVLGLVLGPLVEKHLRESLFLSRGDPAIFVSSKIALTIWAAGLGMLLYSPVRALVRGLARPRSG